jgi:hypothetical protein
MGIIHRNRLNAAGTVLVMLALVLPAAYANINLEWRPLEQTVNVGDPVGVGLYAVSDSTADQLFNSVQVILAWEPSYLQLIGVDQSGSIGLFTSAFTAGDSFGLNETNPPTDGDGMWFGFVSPGQTRPATPAGSLLTTIMFQALAETPSSLVDMLDTVQNGEHPAAFTKVIQGTDDVVGTLSISASVEIVVPEPSGLFLFGAVALTLANRRR